MTSGNFFVLPSVPRCTAGGTRVFCVIYEGVSRQSSLVARLGGENVLSMFRCLDLRSDRCCTRGRSNEVLSRYSRFTSYLLHLPVCCRLVRRRIGRVIGRVEI